MTIATPSYYKSFRCIADKCKNSCCVGWEIDIDPDTLASYESDRSEFGLKILSHIARDDENAHFKLTDDGKCPFLNKSGLCDIICEKGEEALCQICTDHPRFRNFYSECTEIGIGMSCEEAARIIITWKDTFAIEYTDEGAPNSATDDEKAFFADRTKALGIIADRTLSIDRRIECLGDEFGFTLPQMSLDEINSIYSDLEQLDSQWQSYLDMLCLTFDETPDVFSEPQWQQAFEQLISYYIYRHTPPSVDDGLFNPRMMFALLSFRVIRALCAAHLSVHGTLTIENLIEYSRIYSSEIEYCEENTDILIEEMLFR